MKKKDNELAYIPSCVSHQRVVSGAHGVVALGSKETWMAPFTEEQEIVIRSLTHEVVMADLPQAESMLIKAIQESVDVAVSRMAKHMDPVIEKAIISELQEIITPLEDRIERLEAAFFRRGKP